MGVGERENRQYLLTVAPRSTRTARQARRVPFVNNPRRGVAGRGEARRGAGRGRRPLALSASLEASPAARRALGVP